MRDRDRLVARINQMRRAAAPGAGRRAAPAESTPANERDQVQALRAQVTALENMVQGLQDAVHRETNRLSKRVASLETQIQPAVLGRSLSDDARRRGL